MQVRHDLYVSDIKARNHIFHMFDNLIILSLRSSVFTRCMPPYWSRHIGFGRHIGVARHIATTILVVCNVHL